MRSKLFLSVFAMTICMMSVAQYANDWINYSQHYYKIQVSEDGVYRVTAAELQAAGVDVNSIPVSRFQLFNKGKEIAIMTNDSDGDGKLNYLEFFGEKNDGSMDTELYLAPEAQPHSYYSLFSDASYYFLTWYQVSGAGKRMELSTIQDATGYVAEEFHLVENLTTYSSQYAPGLYYGSTNEILSPKYDYGEGWTGPNFNSSKSYSLSLSNAYTSGPVPKLEIVFVGTNNNAHKTDISVGASTSALRSLQVINWNGRYSRTYTASLDWSDISASGGLEIKISCLNSNDQISVASVKLIYPQSFVYSGIEKIFGVQSSSAQRAYVKIPTTSASALRVLDVTDPVNVKSIAKSVFSDRLEFVYANPTTAKQLLVFPSTKTVTSISRVIMTNPALTTSDYLIVYHKNLDVAVDGVNPITAYATYRKSAAGGSHQVVSMEIDDVFNQFSYGYPSAIGIKNLAKRSVNAGAGKFLLLIGKGTSTELNYYRNPGTTLNLVPTFGQPGADELFSVNIKNGNDVPALATGRVGSRTPADVLAYLNKVKEMEALAFDDLWRKNILQLSGGLSSTEQRSYANFIRNFETVAAGDYMGANVTNIHKNSSEQTINIPVNKQVNEGLSLITFFGHSSAIVNDIEIGRASDPDAGYTNKGKYPVILMNGCNAGSVFGNNSDLTNTEDWVNTADRGAIAVMANSAYASSASLKRWSDLFYLQNFALSGTFAMPIGEVKNLLSERYFNLYGTGGSEVSQVYQTLLQGDPAVKLFGANQPDYQPLSTEINASGFDNGRVLASLDSFRLEIPVANYGKTVGLLLEVQVTRKLEDGSEETFTRNFPKVLRKDTLNFTIYNDAEKSYEGINQFDIKIDPNSKQQELNEQNNAAVFTLFIPKGNTIALFPQDFATVTSHQPELIWQSANQLETNRNYSLQVDTSALFRSSYLISETLNGDLLMRYPLNLTALPDSTTIYWRTRFAEIKGSEDTSWVESTFTLTRNGSQGWGQIGNYQFVKNDFSGVQYDPASGKLVFDETVTPLQIDTHGPQSGLAYTDFQVTINGVNYLITDNLADPVCRTNTINAVIFNKESAAPYRPFVTNTADVYDNTVCGRLPQMIYNFSESDVLLQNRRYLDTVITLMDKGDMILVFSFDSVAYKNWDDRVKNSLASVGIKKSTINGLVNGQPVIFLGRKGEAEGTALEVISNGGALPVKEQSIEFTGDATGKFSSGSLTSVRVGPAVDWQDFNYVVDAEATDIWAFVVTAISPNGERKKAFAGKRTTAIDVSQIDASQYPYLDIAFSFSDTEELTPPKLKAWGVTYQTPPEGFLSMTNQQSPTLQEGAIYSGAYVFTNISKEQFTDSVEVSYTVTNLSDNTRYENLMTLQAPAPGDSTVIKFDIDTRGKLGENNLLVNVATADRERFTSNNLVNKTTAFKVIPDEVNPVLDVTFDGGYILNGDIVSPNPLIVMKMKDENVYLVKSDTTGMKVELKAPCETCIYEKVNFTDPKLVTTPATETEPFQMTYEPGPLEDGVYHLRVSVTDASGNSAGLEPYEISFEVVNEATITHFYPYPNPFSTQTRFVFTLTGSEIPDHIKIQIMTISGRVVREITQDEIGPIRIGNNISQYAWDGRDEFGDQLANGVYLYRVYIESAGDQLQHRNTGADRAFKNGFGKLYILR